MGRGLRGSNSRARVMQCSGGHWGVKVYMGMEVREGRDKEVRG